MNRLALVVLLLVAFVTALPAGQLAFRRGDANDDGVVDGSDPIVVLNFLFFIVGTATPDCFKAADVDDSGGIDVSDASYLLAFLYQGGPAPPAPFPDCGIDQTPDLVSCEESRCNIGDRPFLRGDLNNDHLVNSTDVLLLSNRIQSPWEILSCEDAADINDSGHVSGTDLSVLSVFLFTGGDPPAPPFLFCGDDVLSDILSCDFYACQ